jgi:hypothetical protein
METIEEENIKSCADDMLHQLKEDEAYGKANAKHKLALVLEADTCFKRRSDNGSTNQRRLLAMARRTSGDSWLEESRNLCDTSTFVHSRACISDCEEFGAYAKPENI